MCDTPEELYLVSKYCVVTMRYSIASFHEKGIFELIAWMADLFLCSSTNSKCIAIVENKLKRSIRMPSLINCTNCIEQKIDTPA